MNILPISQTESYRVEEYSDEKAGAIIRLVPVTADGTQDPFRTELFIGKTTIGTNRGPLDLRFPISASSLMEAFANWAAGLQFKLAEIESEQVKAKILNGAQLSASQARALTNPNKKR